MERREGTNLGDTELAAMEVASCRMRSAVCFRDVLDAIEEIVLNLIGSEEYALFAVDEDGCTLTLLASVGIDEIRYRTIPLGAGPIGCSVMTDDVYVADDGPEDWRRKDPDLTACVPLQVDGVVAGAIAVFRLLPQKLGVEAIDRDLLELLGRLAAPALHRADRPERPELG
jgi:chemotaxis protein CheD